MSTSTVENFILVERVIQSAAKKPENPRLHMCAKSLHIHAGPLAVVAHQVILFEAGGLAYYTRLGIHLKAVLTDNGPAYRFALFDLALFDFALSILG